MVDYLESAQLQMFFKSIERERDKLLALLLYESGCSISEVSSLKANNIKTDGTVHFDGRISIISPALAQAILKQTTKQATKQTNSYAFSSRQDESITPKRIQQILKPYLQKVHKGKITPHVLRYTHIIHAYSQGLTIGSISSQTGITPVRVAQIVAFAPTQLPKEYSFRREGGAL